VVAGLAGFYLLSSQPIWLRWIIVLASIGLGGLVSLQSYQGKTFWAFVQGSRIELRKVVWPTGKETRQVTLVVFIMVIVMSLFFWGLDTLLALLTKYLTGRGG
jgi:preprotein translocase subunit SecE